MTFNFRHGLCNAVQIMNKKISYLKEINTLVEAHSSYNNTKKVPT